MGRNRGRHLSQSALRRDPPRIRARERRASRSGGAADLEADVDTSFVCGFADFADGLIADAESRATDAAVLLRQGRTRFTEAGRYVAGIQPTAPGYRQIQIKPYPVGNLTNASTHITTPLGKVSFPVPHDGARCRIAQPQ